jgi:hypothetical protein
LNRRGSLAERAVEIAEAIGYSRQLALAKPAPGKCLAMVWNLTVGLGSAVIIPLPHRQREGAYKCRISICSRLPKNCETAEEALTRAETFHDPDCKRLMRQIAATYEELAERLEREAGAADNS